MRFKLFLVVFAALLAWTGAARATAHIHIDLSSQRMHVTSSQSGAYCLAGAGARHAVPKTGSCPSDYSTSGGYCLASR